MLGTINYKNDWVYYYSDDVKRVERSCRNAFPRELQINVHIFYYKNVYINKKNI